MIISEKLSPIIQIVHFFFSIIFNFAPLLISSNVTYEKLDKTWPLGSDYGSVAPHLWRRSRKCVFDCWVEFPERTRPLLASNLPPHTHTHPFLALQFSRLAEAQQRAMLSPACSLLSPTGHTRYHWCTQTRAQTNLLPGETTEPPTHSYTYTQTHTHTHNIVGPHSCRYAWRLKVH